MNSKAIYWIESAEYDLDTAKAMFDTGRYLYVGFTCHLTVEKLLKAAIANSGKFPPKIHNLPKLADEGNITGKLSEKQIEFLVRVNPLNIEGRYPKYRSKINSILTPDRCKELIQETEEFYVWMQEYLK